MHIYTMFRYPMQFLSKEEHRLSNRDWEEASTRT